MARKKRKKKTGIQLEDPTFFGSVGNHKGSVIMKGLKGSATGAGAGGAVSTVMGYDPTKSVIAGTVTGLTLGLADGAISAYETDKAIHEKAEEMADELDALFSDVADSVGKIGTVNAVDLANEIAKAFGRGNDNDDDDDDGDDDDKNKKGKGKGGKK